MKKAAIVIILLLFISFCFSFVKFPIVNATVLTFDSSTSDCFGMRLDATYSDARTGGYSFEESSSASLFIGQDYDVFLGGYFIYRGYLYFYTASLPNDATIDGAVLSLYVVDNESDSDFNVTVQSGQPTYPHDPYTSTDYYYSYYSGDGGSANTSSISGTGYWNITLNSDGYDMISLTGWTKLCLRSSKDIAGTAPSGDEYVEFEVAEDGSSYIPKLYVDYSITPDYSTLTVSSSPEVNAFFTVNDTEYYTPSYVSVETDENATMIADTALIYGGEGWYFDHWLINGTDSYDTETLTFNITDDTTAVIYYSEIPDLYHFYGPYDEETGLLLDENVTVNVFYNTSDYPQYQFAFNTSWVYPPDTNVMYFEFVFADESTREYWVDSSELVTSIYVFHGNQTGLIQTYTINFLDTTGILNDYPYITIKRYVNGTEYTIEKRRVDIYNSFIANLIYGRTYQIYLGNEETTYVFGNLVMTSDTSVQLVIRGVDFPKDSDFLILQKYIRFYAYRNYTANPNTITMLYEDTKEETYNVTISLTNSTDEVYSNTLYTDSFEVEWSNAVNGTTYYLEAVIEHESYGNLEYRIVIPGSSDVSPPFGLEFLGDWGFDSYMIIPALLCLCVAGCFSKLNAYVGAILMMIVAVALAWMGWFPVPASMLVTGFMLAVLMALVWHKRGVLT